MAWKKARSGFSKILLIFSILICFVINEGSSYDFLVFDFEMARKSKADRTISTARIINENHQKTIKLE